jgi:DNA-binding NarL/FixJ family response regulator
VPLRIFLSGRPSDALEALRRRLLADSNLELVDRAELADAVVSLPRAHDEHEEPLIEALTEREHDVLVLVSDGLSNREIAGALAISEHTVKFHLASIFGKLGASTRTEAVHRGLRHGVIEI